MEAAYHIDILKRSIGHRVPSQALEIMIAANLGQDSLIGLTHLEYHFDANLFEMSQSYVDGQRILAQRWWGRPAGWAAFGRLSHTVADFYAHSNYVRLWLAGALGSAPGQVELALARDAQVAPAVTAIPPLEPDLITHPDLRSGRVYWVRDILGLIPGMGRVIYPLMPADSHARMNLDHPGRGPLFPYAMEAAVARTVIEYDRVLAALALPAAS
ncbi:MAG TPA: hypothetical protein PLC98_20135 [Anaerolineales bacterium]|nr:hypothetical protein [Anaerolineales bacterium]